MKILIVGAGIGGLTLASFLKDSSIDFEVIDKVSSWSKQGYSLGIWNNGRRILEKLGLADEFDKAGSRIRHYRICDGKGKLLRNYDLTEFYSQYALAYTHVDRDLLHRWLIERVGEDEIHLGVKIKSVKENPDGIIVETEEGQAKKYDLVVGADGIHSQVRSLVFGDNYEKFDNWRVWYAWVDTSFKQGATVSEFIEAGEFIGVFDVGTRALVVLIAPADHSTWDDVKGRIDRLRVIFKDEVILSKIFEKMQDQEVVPTDLSHIKMNNWFNGRTVLMGDAAHGFEPHAGLGASMAMEDGYVLAGELLKVSAEYSLKEALQAYQNTRKKRVHTALQVTNRMRAWAFIKSKLLRKIINLIVPFVPQYFFTNKYHKLLKEEI